MKRYNLGITFEDRFGQYVNVPELREWLLNLYEDLYNENTYTSSHKVLKLLEELEDI